MQQFRRSMTPERFYSKGVRSGSCLIWTGKSRIGPYGCVGYRYEKWLCHRLSYYFEHGDIPDGLVIRHTCDTPLCIEPKHLLSGTHADNVADKVSRLRQPRHEAHHNARLTVEQVEDIRSRHSAGEMQKDLALEYGMSKTQVWKIIHHMKWKGD